MWGNRKRKRYNRCECCDKVLLNREEWVTCGCGFMCILCNRDIENARRERQGMLSAAYQSGNGEW